MGAMKSRSLLVAAVLLAVLAVFWPEAPSWPSKGAGSSNGSATCPFGFTGSTQDLPPGHPPVLPSHATSTPEDEELVLWHGGTIWTGDDKGTVEAMLVAPKDGLVLGVGSAAELTMYARSFVTQQQATSNRRLRLRQQNLEGAFLMPGFVEPHVHFMQAGLFLAQANLGPATSKAQFQQLLSDHLAKMDGLTKTSGQGAGASSWVQGGQWDEGKWGGALPNRTWLDEVTGPTRPAVLSRADSHMVVCNSAALRLAGINADTPHPEGGIVDKDAQGQPTGILREHAIRLVTRLIPRPSKEVLQQALQMATDYALSRGVTSVNDLGRAPFTGDLDTTWQDLQQVYMPAADAGQLRIRIMAFLPLRTWSRAATHLEVHGRNHPGLMLHYGGVKEFADGSLGARTALMWQPYSDLHSGDQAHEHGSRMISQDELLSLTQAADAAGLTVAVHAIGDRAIDETLDVFERVRLANAAHHAARADALMLDVPVWFHATINTSSSSSDGAGGHGRVVRIQGPRHRIEHFQHVSGPGVGQRAAALGVSATPNPLHLVADGELMQRRLGPHRAGAGYSYAFKSLTDEGLAAGFSTDWPVTDLDPLAGVYVCMHRRDAYAAPSDGGGWGPEEAMAGEAALRGHTSGSAYTALLEDFVGTLRAGMRADFVVLSSSPLDMQPGQPLPAIKGTYVDGRCAWGCARAAPAITAQSASS